MDEALLRALNGWTSSPTFAAVAVALSSRWLLAIVGLILAVVHLRARRYAVVISAALALGAADLISAGVLKPIFDRERPCRAVAGLERPVSCGPGRSFPSAHAANGFALAVTGATGVAGWAALVPLATLVALSRVALGVHYPSDIAGGAAVGAAIGGLTLLVRRRWTRRQGSGR